MQKVDEKGKPHHYATFRNITVDHYKLIDTKEDIVNGISSYPVTYFYLTFYFDY